MNFDEEFIDDLDIQPLESPSSRGDESIDGDAQLLELINQRELSEEDKSYLFEYFDSENKYNPEYPAYSPQELPRLIVPRPAQVELFQKSINTNSIIFLETGMGKTVVAMMHIYYFIRLKGPENVKIIFLANTIQLVEQQCQSIRDQIYGVALYMEQENLVEREFNFDINLLQDVAYLDKFISPVHGNVFEEDEYKGWDSDRWYLILERSCVFVMIGQILLNALRRGYLKVPYFSLIIMDECHHTKHNHQYRLIIKEFIDDPKVTTAIPNSDTVKILGLTASPVTELNLESACRAKRVDGNKIELDLLNLASNMHSKFQFVQSTIEPSNKTQQLTIIKYDQPKVSASYLPNNFKLQDLYVKLGEIIRKSVNTSLTIQIFIKSTLHYMTIHAISILSELGIYAYYQYYKCFVSNYKLAILKKPTKQANDDEIINELTALFDYYLIELEEFDVMDENTLCNKFVKLLENIQEQQLQQELNELKQKQIIVFVQQKIVCKYLCILLQQCQVNCDFVVGSGNKSSENLQFTILKKKDTEQLLENLQPANIQQLAENVYNQFRIGGVEQVDEDNEDADLDLDIGREQIKNKLQEVHEGIINMGKGLQEELFKLKEQQLKIKNFREFKFNVLISTSVTEEGFDIPNCEVVIMYGEIKSLKQFIQQRGRARKEESQILVIAKAEQNRGESSIELKIQVLEKALELVKSRAKEAQQCQNVVARIRELQVMIDKNAKFDQEVSYYERILVKGSLALVNTNWAVELLTNYVNMIHPIKSGMRQNDNYIRGVFYHYVQIPACGYRCVIILPKSAQLRYFIGDVHQSKEYAKRSAAYKAVIAIRKVGLLTDDLRPIKDKVIRLFQIDQKEDVNLQDPEYSKVIKEVTVTRQEINNDVAIHQKFFPYKLDILNITFQEQFYLYKFTFHYTDKNIIDSDKHLNYEQPVEIGFIHNLLLDQHAFYEGNEIRLELIGNIKLTEQEYEYYHKIHLFLIATTNDWDIQYYSCITQVPLLPNSNLFSQGKIQPFDSIDNSKQNAILVCLNKQTNKIDLELCNQIIKYHEYMNNAYKLLNKLKQEKLENKKIKEQRERLNDPSIKLRYWQKLQADRQVLEKLYKLSDKDNKDIKGYVVQNISEQYHLGKMVIMEGKEIYIDESADSVKQDWEKIRDQQLRSIIDHSFNDQKLYATQILKKHLSYDINNFKKNPTKPKTKALKHIFYPAEFTQFPLNIGTCFKLRIIVPYILQKVRDYMIACKFKQIKFPISLPNQRVPPMEYNILDNLILGQSRNLIRFFQNDKNELQFIIQRLQDNKNIIVNHEFEMLHPTKQTHKFYSIQDIDNVLIYRCLQSQQYNQQQSENYQVLEFLGDAILKLLACQQVFVERPYSMEGDLHMARARIICNENLKRVAIINRIFESIMCFKFEYWSPEFIVEKDTKIDQERYKAMLNGVDIDSMPVNYQAIPDKVHADVVEALNGAYMLKFRDVDACQTFFYQIGLLKNPTTELALTQKYNYQVDEVMVNNLNTLQNILGYQFQNLEFLVQAITHISFLNPLDFFQYQNTDPNISSYKDGKLNLNFTRISREENQQGLFDKLNRVQVRPDISYERLEFLGDSVLDAVVVEWLVDNFPKDDPGDLSLKKQCIVCNKALALVALHYKFDLFLLHENLHQPTHNNYKILQNIKAKYNVYYNDINEMYTKEPMVKVLGDIVESLIGAIYLDCQFNYNLIKKIVLRLLAQFMEHFSSPNQLLKHPQDKLALYFKQNNLGEAEIVISNEESKFGEYEYVLRSVQDGTVLKRVRAQSEKEAREKILERIAKKGGLDQ